MTSDVGQTLLMLGEIICLIVLVIWAFWFLERFRGGNAARPGAQRR
jgi:flagellar biogenesis protein FliO